jgi:hypothetical protein
VEGFRRLRRATTQQTDVQYADFLPVHRCGGTCSLASVPELLWPSCSTNARIEGLLVSSPRFSGGDAEGEGAREAAVAFAVDAHAGLCAFQSWR